MSDTTDHSLAAQFQFFRRHKLGNSSDSTRYQYQLNLRRFDEFLGRPAQITDLRDEVVNEATGWIQRDLKLSPASASKFRDNLCCLWRFLARKNIVSHWPDVAEVREPRRIPVAWTREQLAALWQYLQRMPGDLVGIPAADWFCSLHAVLWDSGSRIGEAMQLEWPQVDLQGGWVVMRAETRKGRLSDKLSRLHPSTVELLERIRLPERQRVWPWPYNYSYLWRLYGDVLKRAGLPCDRQRKFHCIRKSVASHITALGGDAQAALGHATRQQTEQNYIDQRIAQPKGPADYLFRLGDDGDPPKAA